MANREIFSGASRADFYADWSQERVRYNDVDMQGHVNNAVYPVYFEAGRIAFRDALGVELQPGHGSVIAEYTVRFLRPITWPAVISVGTKVVEIGRSSSRYIQALFVDGECAAVCEAVLVAINRQTGKPTEIGDAERAALLKSGPQVPSKPASHP